PFHTDLYRREALEAAVAKYAGKARVELEDAGAHVLVRLEPLGAGSSHEALLDEFCNEVFSGTARRMRAPQSPAAAGTAEAADGEPPWALLAPYGAGTVLGLGW